LSLLFCAPVDAAEPADPPKTLMERVDREMTRLQIQIKNGRIRYQNGVLGVDQEGLDPKRPPTPFTACCTANLKKMKRAVSELTVVFGELGSCYEDAGDATGSATALQLAEALVQLDAKVDALASAAFPRAVDHALANLTSDFIQMRDQVSQLEDCVVENKGKKKKKKQDKSRAEG
jgi:hypothetical protein